MLKTFLATALSTVVLSLALTTTASATDARQAIKLCDKNPNCDYQVHANGDVLIFVGDDIIDCPQEGQCACSCTHKGASQTGAKSVAAILSRRY